MSLLEMGSKQSGRAESSQSCVEAVDLPPWGGLGGGVNFFEYILKYLLYDHNFFPGAKNKVEDTFYIPWTSSYSQ